MREELQFEAVGQWPGELEHVKSFAFQVAARHIIEIGVCEGRWIWEVAPKCSLVALHYIGIDPAPKAAWSRVRAALEGDHVEVEFYNTRSDAESTLYALRNAQADILHIDGDHAIGSVLNDYDLYAPHVRLGGIIVLHDTASGKGPGEALQTILSSDRRKRIQECLTVFEPNHPWDMGLAILRMRT